MSYGCGEGGGKVQNGYRGDYAVNSPSYTDPLLSRIIVDPHLAIVFLLPQGR